MRTSCHTPTGTCRRWLGPWCCSGRQLTMLVQTRVPLRTRPGAFSRTPGQRQQHRHSRPLAPCVAVPLPEALTASLFAASTLYAAALGALMVLAPHSERTKSWMRPVTVLLPLAIVYGVLLGCSWEPDTLSIILPGSWEEGLKGGFKPQFFPQLQGIMSLFSRLVTAASLWVHLLAINLFAARSVYLEGLELGVPTWHSILLCFTLSPLGLLSHFLTKGALRQLKPTSTVTTT